MKPKVIVTPKIYDEPLAILKEYCDVTVIDELNERTYENLLKQLINVHGILNMGLRVDKELLDRAPNLKIVSNISVGYDNLDISEINSRGVMATNTPGVLNDTTADAVMALMLSTARRITELDHYVRSGQWKGIVEDHWFGLDVAGKTLGIIGMGRIGSDIAKRAHLGFGMEILYHNRTRNKEAENMYSCQFVSLDELLRKSDFVVLMTPLTSETKHMIGKREFKLMKESAIFINASRGPTVNEEELILSLENKWIYGAGLDVYEVEPIKMDNPLLNLTNVVLLPHVGGATINTRYKMMNLAVQNIIDGLYGRTPKNLITV